MAAAQLQHDHPNWLVLWGCYTHVYVAFPLFRAPRGTVLTATVPADLVVKMRRQERFAGVHAPPPGDAAAPGGPAAPGVGAPLWPSATAPPAAANRDQPAAQGWYAAPGTREPPARPPGPPNWPGSP